ncbi:hypothetical protein Tco_1068008 [Tanacetum coccineum]|uniref:Uncharacterized protein n=1 Tax=Tanacetum coccineum TaxID=301880 RepID=A0ABQ5HFY5_9ASTR
MLKKHNPSKDVGLPASSLTQGLLAWQSVCSHSNLTVTIEHPMIRRFEGTRSKAKGACEQTKNFLFMAINKSTLSLTRDI